MSRSAYDIAEYQAWLVISDHKRLLVEGADDQRAFSILLDKFFTRDEQNNIEIDTAEALIGFGPRVGNREKVEQVCASVEREPYADKLVGFVDREFREFEYAVSLQDLQPEHRVSGRLVWSRGHSLENYFFDFAILRDPMLQFTSTEYFHDVLDRFERLLESTIRTACAASLAGQESDTLLFVSRRFSWEYVEISSTGREIIVNCDTWEQAEQNKPSGFQYFCTRFANCLERVRQADINVVRWMCHGHMGLRFLWEVYARCVFEASQRAGEEQRKETRQPLLQADDRIRFNACVDSWARTASANQCEYPSFVLAMLGLHLGDQPEETL